MPQPPSIRPPSWSETARRLGSAAVVALGLTLLGCGGSVSPTPAYADTSKLVEARSGRSVARLKNDQDQRHLDERVQRILGGDLTLDGAIEVALLRSRTLSATFEELGVAQADLVQAGLLRNPTLSGAVQIPLRKGESGGYSVGITQSLLDAFALSARKRFAATQLEGVKLRVASMVIGHVFAVKEAYYAVVAANQMLAMRRAVGEAAQLAVELAERQHEAGTISDLALANERALFAELMLSVRRSEAEAATARERLNRAMGVWGADAGWHTSMQLPDVPDVEPDLEHVEAHAIRSRLDLAAANRDIEVVSYALSLATNTRFIGGLEAGVSYEKSPEGGHLLGPSLSVELPLFDQRQATIARLEAQLRQARDHEYALAVEIRSEVREKRARLQAARGIVDAYRTSVVPLRRAIVKLSQEQYDAMLLGVFQLLLAKQSEIAAFREYIDAVRDYWTLRAELEWQCGGSLPPAPPGAPAVPAAVPASSSAPPAAPDPEHHHHEGAH